MTTFQFFGGKLQVYRRGSGKTWHCAARVGEQRFRSTTGEQELSRAEVVAEEWYLGLRGKLASGTLGKPKEKTFGEAASHYLGQARVLAAAVRSPRYVAGLELKMKSRVLPFFQDYPISEVNRGLVQTYRVERMEQHLARTKTETQPGRNLARSTFLQELVIIRQVLKHAEGLGWIKFVPNLSMPYMSIGKKERRAWFSPEEYQQFVQATRRRITNGTRRGWRSHYEDMHDFVLFMANTGLRPDEAARLEFRDVVIEDDPTTKKPILVLDVRGKTGVGYCKSMPGAVHPFERLRARRIAELANACDEHERRRVLLTTRVFRPFDRDLFNAILSEEGLKHDRDGRVRTAYSLRHTYISFRLMDGAHPQSLANNCRTSIQMIQDHYAAHLKDRLDTSLINVERPKSVRAKAKASSARRREDLGDLSP